MGREAFFPFLCPLPPSIYFQKANLALISACVNKPYAPSSISQATSEQTQRFTAASWLPRYHPYSVWLPQNGSRTHLLPILCLIMAHNMPLSTLKTLKAVSFCFGSALAMAIMLRLSTIS